MMTYDQAIQNGYTEQVKAVHGVSVDYTGRQVGDGTVEFSGSHKFTGADGFGYTMTAYYLQDADDVTAAGDNLDELDWHPTRYEVT